MDKKLWLQRCFYRVSLKAVILNELGEVLLVKEKNNDSWNLPGGGMDYEEDEKSALARELKEEVGYDGEFGIQPLGIEPMYLEGKGAWQLWVVYKVTPVTLEFSVGVESNEITFMDPELIKESHPRIYGFVKKAV